MRKRTLSLCQGAYIALILARFNMNGADMATPRCVQRLESPSDVTVATHLSGTASCPNFAVCIGKPHTVPYSV
ncbi:hypothetical protein EDB85DRAFT_2001673 [Lactarius pseudohatsudake]|nr:hypothetical protein EDB85DRAFT_2001673 [Lactarius pseudohatsudake]